ncbi:hypothetical protein D3C72_1755100 [compost metagenome]
MALVGLFQLALAALHVPSPPPARVADATPLPFHRLVVLGPRIRLMCLSSVSVWIVAAGVESPVTVPSVRPLPLSVPPYDMLR